ncbi:hypothetical protein SAMN02910398_00685 [Butyrivibrio sp. YAB3001]|nr:hypothetical protein SAMN02910398_00685 [Butyrivibrio sp. YAB3001]
MRNLLRRLFHGRYGSYGSDSLTRFLLIFAIVLLLISIVLEPLSFLYYVAFAALVYCYFRLFSKNITKRYKENELFTGFIFKLKNIFKKK